MNYALQSIWHDRSRYLPGVLAVAFSAVLMSLQIGLLFGLFSVTSIPIDYSRADVWVGSPKVLSVDLGRAIPESSFSSRASSIEGVVQVEKYYQAFGGWTKPDGGSELCIVIGMFLGEGSLGVNEKLTPAVRQLLTEPGGIVVDVSELKRLGVKGIGDTAEINGKSVRVVGLVDGMSSLAGPYVLCSLPTAADLLLQVIPQGKVTYLLLKCDRPDRVAGVVRQLSDRYSNDMTSFTSTNFAYHSKKHWVTKTKAGIAIGYAALLGLLVGMVVTSQTLYAATTASAKEYATLLALGIPRSRVSRTVLAQSFWVGIAGLIVAYPATLGFKEGAALLNVKVLLSPELLIAAAGITMMMAMVAGMVALRSVTRLEPTTLLR